MATPLTFEHDPATGAIYISLGAIADGAVARTQPVGDLMAVDFADDGTPVGVELAGGLQGSGDIARLWADCPALGSFKALRSLLGMKGRTQDPIVATGTWDGMCIHRHVVPRATVVLNWPDPTAASGHQHGGLLLPIVTASQIARDDEFV